MYTQFKDRSLEETRCLLMEEMVKKYCSNSTKKNSVCWYDICVEALFLISLEPQYLEMQSRDFRWTKEDSDKLKNGDFFSPMWLYMGYLNMFAHSYNDMDMKIRNQDCFQSERRDIGYTLPFGE